MQRAGALVCAASTSSETRLMTLDAFSRSFVAVLRQEVPVEKGHEAEVGAYLRGLSLWRRYGPKARETPPTVIEIQDAWLSDPAIPSATGAVTPAAAADIPALAVGLRLVRRGNHTLTARGRLVRLLSGEGASSVVNHRWSPNPYLVQRGLGLAILYALLDADGDVLVAAFRSLLESDSSEFTRYRFAVDHLTAGCERLRRAAVKRGLSGEDVARVRRLSEMRESILQTARTKDKAETWGGGRPPDQAATVRLEPYVDLGLLTKADRFSYTYSLNASQHGFFAFLADAQTLQDVVDQSLVAAYLRGIGAQAVHKVPRDVIWEPIEEAYGDMRSGMGYAAFAEVILLAIGRLVDDGTGGYFEMSEGVDVIREHQRAAPAHVQLTVARGGALRYMRIKGGG